MYILTEGSNTHTYSQYIISHLLIKVKFYLHFFDIVL